MSGSAKVPSALGVGFGSTRDLDLGGGADAEVLRGAGFLSAASSLSVGRFSDVLPLSSSSAVGGGCCGGGGIEGAAAFGGRSPLGVEGLGGLATGGGPGTGGGGLLGGGPNGGLLNLLGLELPLSGTAAFGADGLASDAFASGTDATSAFAFAFGGLLGSGGTAGVAAAVELQGAAPTEDGGTCGA